MTNTLNPRMMREKVRTLECPMRRPSVHGGSCGIIDCAVGRVAGLDINTCDECWRLRPATEEASAFRQVIILRLRGKDIARKEKREGIRWTSWPGRTRWWGGINQWVGPSKLMKFGHFVKITFFNFKQVFKSNCDGSCGCWGPAYILWGKVKSVFRRRS